MSDRPSVKDKLTDFIIIIVISFLPVTALGQSNQINEVSFPTRLSLCKIIPLLEREKYLLPVLIVPSRILYLSEEGKLILRKTDSNETVWENEPGGKIIKIEKNTKYIFVVTQITRSTDNHIYYLRALSFETGITVWQKEIENTFSELKSGISADWKDFLFAEDSYVVVKKNKRLEIVSPDNGKTISAKDFDSGIRTIRISGGGSSPLIQTQEGFIYTFSLSDNSFSLLPFSFNQSILKNYKTVGISFPHLFFTDEIGNLTVVSVKNNKSRIRKIRAGGAVTDILLTSNKNVIFTSNDNFVYSINPQNGKKNWQRRLNGRPLKTVLIENDYAIISITGFSGISILNLNTGKIIGNIILGKDTDSVTDLFVENRNVFVITSENIYNYCLQ